jgi:hypothetical protein
MAIEEAPSVNYGPDRVTESSNDQCAGAKRPGENEVTRTVLCEDALSWLPQNTPLVGCSVITSLPDVSSLPHLTLVQWKEWFMAAATLCMNATPDEGVCIFYQTDIKRDGTWVDKGYLCQRAAEQCGAQLLWHKVVCRREAGKPVFGRPGYSHLLCFSKRPHDQVMPAYPDVLPAAGHMTWSQAMGLEACKLACQYVRSHTTSRTVVDPFCGLGSVLAVANEMGLAAIGVEVAHKRARKARNLKLPQ